MSSAASSASDAESMADEAELTPLAIKLKNSDAKTFEVEYISLPTFVDT